METARGTILAIDDDAQVLNLLMDLLEPEGYQVECVHSAAAGLSRLQHGSVDLILADLLLPDMSGLEFCAQVRTRQQLKLVPIIVLSAASGSCWKQSSAAAGANSYISKPFDIDELLGRVRRHLAPLAAVR